ncbi:uncharacterized protein E0L32_007898 [Thyridium curvatum]|uniref:Uncharacterized protein n=1 Tax=Thyridium curvatum TaxID=1093900 RepID=A0A507B2G5_9PEZI|nr:uncharacterized protein E0L32_007898 [Thyridium curvatum]TPX11479.1 hypothetical protein E0L32_007898 [Thyridium curvatum]
MVHLDGGGSNIAQQCGFTRSAVVIIGAGFSGMCMAIKLLEQKIEDFVILEKSTGFGGTWKDNAYPGCCCDTRKYDLYRFVRFASHVDEATWDERAQQWDVSVRVMSGKEAEACQRYTLSTDFLVAGLGQLNEPHHPKIPGEDEFRGKIMHSARWDWSYDLRGKRVGVIGNGATAVQVVPELAKVASHLTIFQRTPNWVIPRMNEVVREWKKVLLRRLPFVMNRLRAETMDSREVYYQALIQRHSTESSDLAQFCQNFIQSQLPDRPDLWKILTPNYPPGCKRILISDDYYPALHLPNVTLETRNIQRITQTGIVVKGHDTNEPEEPIILDLIILATGFSTQNFMHGIKVHGIGKRSLDQIWNKGAMALYGVTVESLPNFGMLYGPNTNLGHNSIILMIEAQVRYLIPLVKEVVSARHRGQALSLMPRPERISDWNKKLQSDLATSSFADPRCSSWYKTEDGLVTNNWSGPVTEYQKLMSTVDWSDFEFNGQSTNVPKGELRIGRIVEGTLLGYRSLISGTALCALAAAGFISYFWQ